MDSGFGCSTSGTVPPASICMLYKRLGSSQRITVPTCCSQNSPTALVVATALREEFASRHEQRADADSEGFRKPQMRALCRGAGRSVLDAWRWKRQLESGAERRRLPPLCVSRDLTAASAFYKIRAWSLCLVRKAALLFEGVTVPASACLGGRFAPCAPLDA